MGGEEEREGGSECVQWTYSTRASNEHKEQAIMHAHKNAEEEDASDGRQTHTGVDHPNGTHPTGHGKVKQPIWRCCGFGESRDRFGCVL